MGSETGALLFTEVRAELGLHYSGRITMTISEEKGIANVLNSTKCTGAEQFTARVTEVWRAIGYHDHEIASLLAISANGTRHVPMLHSVVEYEQRGLTIPQSANVYFGINPLREGITRGRGAETDVIRVVALFADLDVKEGALKNIRECRKVIRKLTGILGIRPAVVIESGRGLQPIWRVANTPKSPNVIRDEDARHEWRVLLRRWGGLVQKVVHEINPDATIDNVYELARVLRCPGSVNVKYDDRPVVTATISSEVRAVRRSVLTAALDAHDVGPLGGTVSVAMSKTYTGWPEAVAWIDAQPGTADGLANMSAGMLKLCDRMALVQAFVHGTDDEASGYAIMRDRVWNAVKLSTEGHGGLSLALLVIRHAYLDAMTNPRGDGKRRLSRGSAENEFQRAVSGAIAAVRGGAQ